MKRVLVLSAVLVVAASSAFAQAGAINLFEDIDGLSCSLYDTGGLMMVNAVHVLTGGATASQWCAPLPNCMVGASWISDTPVFPTTVGNSQIGVSIAYGSCLGSPIHILTINLYGQAATTTCCIWPILPDPVTPSGYIEVVDCASNVMISPTWPSAMVNPNGGCMCNPPVAAEETTWGQLKATYAN